ncbi:MAG: S-layer homology domain-containing protein [Candidatus Peregrinibacteria bacterium]|nr:S-layer homology domain-containing protein [Candidatus Peregrinibacteria bacterium]MDZ4244927.1 S-layer homology domain-containing protein [Candidatus Gracilibacteria bacterium]
MNIIRKIFRSMTMVVLSVLISGFTTPVVPVANAFSDVPYNSYYSEALTWSVNEGVVDSRDLFYPGIPLKRSELAKMTVTAMQVPLDTSNGPSFSDVRQNDWFYSYVETGVNFGVLTGYTDYRGLPSGYFGPANNPTRAEALAAIMRSFGFALNDGECNTVFPDIDYNAWYAPYMESACAYDILRGDLTGHARPADTINRAEFITMLYRAATYFDEGEGSEPIDTNTNTQPTNTTPSNGNSTLMISVAPSTPVPTMIPADAAAVEYTTFALTALGDDVQFNGANLWRTGLGSHNNFSNVWFSVDGFMLGSSRTINSDGYAGMNLGRDYILIPEGQTVLVDIKASMSSTVGANLQNALGFRSASDISSDADTVQGSFPIFGNYMITSSYTAGNITFSNDGSSTANVNVGDSQVTIGQFTLENNSDNREDLVISNMDFEINGSGDFTSLDNAAIYYLGEKVSNTVTPMDDHLRFTFLDGGYLLQDGDSEDFKVKADIVGGDDNDTIRLKIDTDNDITAFLANSSRAFALNVNRVNPSNGDLSTYIIKAGNITFARHSSSPSSTNLPPDTDNVTFLVAQLTVGSEVYVNEMRVYMDTALRTAANGTTVMDSAICADTVTLNNVIKAKIDDIKIWNGSRMAAGGANILASLSAGSFSSPTCTVANAYYTFSDNFQLHAGLNMLSITADLSRFVSAGETFSLSFDNIPSSWFAAEYYQNGDDITSSEINGSATGSIFTIEEGGFVLARQDGYSDGQTIVVGAIDVLLMTFKLEANDTGDVRVTALTVEDGIVDVDGSLITGIGVYDHDTGQMVVRNIQNLGSDDTAQFTGLNIVVPSGGFRLFDVRGTISTAWDPADDIQLFVTNVAAKDLNNNDATVAYPDCQISGCSPNDAIASANFDLSGTAEIVIAFDSRNDNNYDGIKTPTGTCSNYLGCAKKVAELEIHPVNDDVQLRKLVLANDDDSANYASRFGTFFLVDEANGTVIDTGSMSDSGGSADGLVTFSGFGYTLANNGEHSLGVYAAIQNITTLTQTGGVLNLYLPGLSSTYVEFLSNSIGVNIGSSSLTNNATLSSPRIQSYVTRKTKPTITYNLSSKSIGGVQQSKYEVYEFTVAADSSGTVEWQKMTFNVSETAGVMSSNYKLYVKNQSTPLNAAGASVVAGKVVITPDSIQQVPNSGSVTYILKADFLVTNSFESQSVGITLTADRDTSLATGTIASLASADFIWSDRSDLNHNATSADWTDGYLVDSFDIATVNVGYQGTGY